MKPISNMPAKTCGCQWTFKGSVCIWAKCPIRLALVSPLDSMLVHRMVTPSITFASTHSYTYVERGTVSIKHLAQEHDMMSLAWAHTQSAWSGGKSTSHEATVPPCYLMLKVFKCIKDVMYLKQKHTLDCNIQHNLVPGCFFGWSD